MLMNDFGGTARHLFRPNPGRLRGWAWFIAGMVFASAMIPFVLWLIK